MKRIVSILLVILLAMSLSVTVFAESGTAIADKGTLTVEGPILGETYTIYQLLVLESYDEDLKAYSYTVAPGWEDFFAPAEKDENGNVTKEAGVGAAYIKIENGYATWVGGKSEAEFAKIALKYAEDKNIKDKGSVKMETEGQKIVFTDLQLGYYLMDSSLGALCSLNTTDKSVNIREKNTPPRIEKKVQEDSDKEWGDANTAQIGDTVHYRTTITAQPGAHNYVLHDKMEAGLTLNASSVKVYLGAITTDENGNITNTELAAENYTVTTDDRQDKCTFEVAFKQTWLDNISEKDYVLTVVYSAVLNELAEIADSTNDNKTKLSYGDGTETEWDTVQTKTFTLDIVKTDSKKELLKGAEFELYTAKEGGKLIAFVVEENGNYRVATDAEVASADVETTTTIVVDDGMVTVIGLDAEVPTTSTKPTSYWLKETKAPAGYNKLEDRVEVVMDKEANMSASLDGGKYTEGGIQVINQTGSRLPDTGGIGTTLFYVLGGVLILSAVVLLVTKRRMAE